MRDPGILSYYSLENIEVNGLMPKEALVKQGEAFYYERSIGVTRAYSAMAAQQQIDKLVRVYNLRPPVGVEYVILEDNLQYRISLQQVQGEHTDLTLERLEAMFDVYPEQD